MIPIPVRFAIVAIGVVLLAGSWFIGNSVDAGLKYGNVRQDALTKDSLTFSARVIGAFLIVLGLLTWVIEQSVRQQRIL